MLLRYHGKNGCQTKKEKILEEVWEVMRRKHYSIHTERTYCGWITRFILFHGMQEREELFIESKQKIEIFLTQLALEGKVATATQNQAMNALVFLYKKVPQQELTGAIDAVRAPRRKHIPVGQPTS